jgi:hypothetical protein
MRAPVCIIIGYDLDFYEHLPKLFPHTNAKSWFEGDDKKIFQTAFRIGLDCGPMSGFDNAGVDRDFFAGTNVPVPTSSRTFFVVGATAMRACYSPARRASASTRWRASSDKTNEHPRPRHQHGRV